MDLRSIVFVGGGGEGGDAPFVTRGGGRMGEVICPSSGVPLLLLREALSGDTLLDPSPFSLVEAKGLGCLVELAPYPLPPSLSRLLSLLLLLLYPEYPLRSFWSYLSSRYPLPPRSSYPP